MAKRFTYKPWSDAEIEKLREWAALGYTATDIAVMMGNVRTPAAINQKMRDVGLSWRALAAQAPAERAAASPYAEDVPEWLEKLRPVMLPAPTPAARHVAPGNFTLVAGDFHFPQHCERSVAIFLETVAQLKPRRVILNGDTVDLLAVSRYPKDQRHTWDLRQEVTAFHGFLHQLMSLGNAWGLQVLETEANHSGNGTASRWHRYLSDRVPVLYGHPKAEQMLDYRTWFYPEWCPINLVDSVVIADDLLVIHGDIVRKSGAYSAKGHMEKHQSSVMHSHTHRIGQSVQRVPPRGTRPDALRRAYEIGCMCSLQPSYVSAPDWGNGFAIIAHDEAETDYGVELVTIQRGQAVVAALGQTVRAA
jgi:hypothetical protein